MTTSQEKPFLSTLFSKERSPEFVLGYLRSSFISRLHEAVLTVFLDLEKRKEISKAELARRLNKSPSQVTRWLSGPGNWELETVSDLLAGMGCEPDIRVVRIQRAIQKAHMEADTRLPNAPKEKEQSAANADFYERHETTRQNGSAAQENQVSKLA